VTQALKTSRRQARDIFAATGLPTTRHEDWKYTDLARMQAALGENWQQATGAKGISSESLNRAAIPELDAYRIVFANGIFQAAESNLPEHVHALPFHQLIDQKPELAAGLLSTDSSAPLFNGMAAFNAATAADGLYFCVDDTVQLDKPLYLVHLGNGGTAAIRHGIVLGKHAGATLIEHFAGPAETSGLTSIVNNIHLQADATLTHYRIQQESLKQFQIGRVDVKQAENSRYVLYSVELGGALARTDIVVGLNGQGASCELNGLFVLAGRQHIDHHTRVDHAGPHCVSREHYRTVLDGRARAVFNGKIVVHEGAVKTDSSQSNANLLLSDKAEVDTKPELEIYNDDVKCSHGATVGQLDMNQLFYLKSRGLPEEEARQVLTFAFADAALIGMDDKVRKHIEKAAFAKLSGLAELEGLLV